MKYLSLVLFIFLYSAALAQMPNTDAILEEGKLLYKLEKASWYSTDHFLTNFGHRANQAAGYISYEDEGKVHSIFYSKFTPIKALARYTFEGTPTEMPTGIDTLDENLRDKEAELIAIRHDAMEQIYSNKDSFFTFYRNTSYNPIPVINGKSRKVYILTAPKEGGSILLGNDYLLEYNSKSELINRRKLHNSLIELPLENPEEEGIEATMHTHILSNHIEPTDICTLLLYKDYAEWKQHYVIHSDYISIFNMEKEGLIIITKEAFDKMQR